MGHKYKLPQSAFVKRGPKRVTSQRPVGDGWAWTLECGHQYTVRSPAYEGARLTCPACDSVFSGAKSSGYQTKGK